MTIHEECWVESRGLVYNCGMCTAETDCRCPICSHSHGHGTKSCIFSSTNVQGRQSKIDKREEIEKEFDEIFPKLYYNLCIYAQMKAFLVSLAFWESLLVLVWWLVIRPYLEHFANVFESGLTISIAIIIFVVAIFATNSSYRKKRQELLEEYLETKTINNKE